MEEKRRGSAPGSAGDWAGVGRKGLGLLPLIGAGGRLSFNGLVGVCLACVSALPATFRSACGFRLGMLILCLALPIYNIVTALQSRRTEYSKIATGQPAGVCNCTTSPFLSGEAGLG